MNRDPFALPLASALDTARGRIAERRGVLVTVERDGVRGTGEATPLPDWTESYEACERALARAAERDADGADSDGVVAACEDAPAARHGVALAFADAAARESDESLYRHLGGDATVARLPVNATVGDAPPDETAVRVREAARDGFETVKVKVGARPLEADRARLRAARDAAPEIDLRADANGAWGRETAGRAVDALAALDVALLEQPLPADDLSGHAALRGRGVPIALDESVPARGLAAVLDADAADAVVLKPMALGGPGRAVAAGERARAAGVDPVVTTTFDAVYARTAAVHVAAALAPLPACGLATGDALAADLAPDPAPVRDGAVSVPQGKGHGVPAPSDE
ncbi:MAG: enolase C-terminal domain-like protein [Halarchaeum sp.]